MRAYDGEVWGPWSWAGAQTGCYFTYDPTIPEAPTVDSVDYDDDDVAHGGVGEPGAFTIKDPSGAANSYQVTMNDQQPITVPTTAGAARTVSLAPDRAGPNVLTVQSFTAASQNSAPTTYKFVAGNGSPEKVRFTLDEPAGATALNADVRTGESAVAAAASGGTTLGAAGQDGTAMGLDGVNGKASTSGALVDATKSFSVGAWVRLDASKVDAQQVVLSQDGTRKSPFYLKYDGRIKKWLFGRTKTDSDESGWYQAESAQNAQLGAWTHLVGVYDATVQRLRIFVNGEPGIESGPIDVSWTSTGGFQIGCGKWLGVTTDYWLGSIDDVRIYDRIVGPKEAQELVSQQPVLKARWKLNTDGAGEPAGTPPLNPHNGALISTGAGFAWVSPGGLQLNGDGAYADATTLPLDTSRSFTVAGWVRNLGRPQKTSTVLSVPGHNTNALVLRYVPDAEDPAEAGRWEAQMSNTDSTDMTTVRKTASTSFADNDWDHLAVTYDALNHRLSLYVNGVIEESADGTSQVGDVKGLPVSNPTLNIGRNTFAQTADETTWPDAVDDLWVYEGALTDTQITYLAQPVELATTDGP
ncbi:LamG domain-containing protein [Actinomadura atramentaria]|uniref:LamG domain-containing protein n=1 Tax=Actinomadura atramentaria TaxID=1990 RepID=UPI0003A489B6|nr:LamG domain-containing protein [Actinomadura atramentaria]